MTPQTIADANLGPSHDTLEALLDVTYSWGYEETRDKLKNLYVKAQRGQWQPELVLPWQTEVKRAYRFGPIELSPLFGSDIYNRMSEQEQLDLDWETFIWTLSQFLHGEQGALLATAQIVDAVPDMDSKLYSATQVVDEARHVEVYSRYLHEKLDDSYPINTHLKQLLDLILKDSRWDMKCLGMQIMVEGLALASFAMMRENVQEPLLQAVTTYVMQDEARHVAFGLLALRDLYTEMSPSEVREREDFVYEAAVLMRDRFLFQEVWDKLGLPIETCKEITLHNKAQVLFRQMLFSKIVPAIKKIGLLSDRQRERFQDLGILQYEHCPTPDEDMVEALEVG